MIKFFRKIRQNLLIENKTGKYFKYAIGEILLVVIGILIALQINNWYQNITFKNELKQIVKEASNDLKQDIGFLNMRIKGAKETIYSLDNLLKNGNKMPLESLLSNFQQVHRYSYFVPVNFAYSKLNKHPRTELLPNNLTNNLTSYHSGFSSERNKIVSETLTLYSLNLFRNYLIKYGYPFEEEGLKRPEDLSNLNLIINDTEFIGILRNAKSNWSAELSMLILARELANKNLEIINNYLLSTN
jgi:hypothetical protein